MATTRRTQSPKSEASLLRMVQSHDQVLFGYTDRNTLKYVPGLVDTMGEVSALVKGIKKWGAIGTAALIAGQFTIIFHQYNLWPSLLSFLTHGP